MRVNNYEYGCFGNFASGILTLCEVSEILYVCVCCGRTVIVVFLLLKTDFSDTNVEY